MALIVSDNTLRASQQGTIEPQIVLEIEGVSTIYGARLIQKRVKIGDTGLTFDGSWKIGGVRDIEDQSPLISLSSGTTTTIRQQLQPDKGVGSSISSMQIVLVDKGQEITELVSPGFVVTDIMARRARVYLGFKDVAYPEDYAIIFRGIIDEVNAGPGTITLNIAHPDQKKRQTLFPKVQTKLTSAIGTTYQATATIEEGADIVFGNTSAQRDFTLDSLHPTDLEPTGFEQYIKVDDEWIRFASNARNYPEDTPVTTIREFSRSQFGTSIASHAVGADVLTMYRLYGNVMDVALRLMLSDSNETPLVADEPASAINVISPTERIANTVWFAGRDLVSLYGVRVGDKVSARDGLELGQQDPMKGPMGALSIVGIEVRTEGTLLYIETVSPFFDRPANATPAGLITIFSQYQIYGVGLGMKVDEVDIDEHERLKQLFLSNHEVDIYIKDETNIKDLIEQELYASCGAYSVPRKGKASVGLHIAPIPGSNIQPINSSNVTEPSRIRVKRSLGSNFMNTVIVKLDQKLEEDEFATGVVTQSADSTTRIPVGTRARVIESRALRSTLNGKNLATIMSTRLLNRYKYAAESIDGVKVQFSAGYRIELGDIVLLDGASLGLINSQGADRLPARRFYEVTNKSMDIKTGEISLSLVDTNFATNTRYGLISPSSRIKVGISSTQFVIEAAYSKQQYGTQEYKKWAPFLTNGDKIAIKVRSSDFETRFAQVNLLSLDGNTITVEDLSFTPEPGDVMEFANYDFTGVTEEQKATYAYRSDTVFADGSQQYQRV